MVSRLAPFVTAPADGEKAVAPLFVHDWAAPRVMPRFALPTLMGWAPEFIKMPLPPMVSTWPGLLAVRV